MPSVLWRIVLPYVVFASLWILLSDAAVVNIFSDLRLINIVSTIKGWVFVAVTGALLLILARRFVSNMAVRDIKIQEASRENAFLSELIERSAQPIAVVYPDGRIGKRNQAFMDLVGYTSEELKSINWMTALTAPEWHDREVGHLQELKRTGQPIRYEKEYLCKSGDRVPVELLVDLSEDADGNKFYYGFITDISERKKAEKEAIRYNSTLVEQAKILEKANAELEKFAYVISHDLRQPVRTAINYLTIIEKTLGDGLGGELKKYFGFAISSARRMDALIIDLLDYARVGRKSEPFRPVALAEPVSESLQNLSHAIDAQKAELVVMNDLPTVQGDHSELVRLFQNLIGNAIKFRHPERHPTVEVGHRQDADNWVVWVRDNGIGIEPEFRERVFGVFQRLVPRDAYEGTGIGLTICKNIVENHGGRIWIDSACGGGCVFLMTFPRVAHP